MKKHLFALLILFSCFHGRVFSQVEKIIVETYYVSDSLDATDTIGGGIEIGSKTYRIFIDLAPGSRLKAIYGDANHALRFTSTEKFFNNKADGQTFGKDFAKSRYGENTVALDTWLTLGQTTRPSSKTYFGIPKWQDSNGSFIGGIHSDGGSAEIPDGILANSDAAAGIPITLNDGMDTMSVLPTGWGDAGIVDDSTNIDTTIFGSVKEGTEFLSYNASLQNGGVGGVNPDSNQVLVAQLTTKGEISFELNVIVEVPGSPSPVDVHYVSQFAPGEVNGDFLKLCPVLSYPAACGCTDPNFLEYRPDYSCGISDSCHTRIVYGCMDSMACNFDPAANFHIQNLCCYPGYCSDRDLSIVCPALTNNRAKNLMIELFPNPAKDELTVQFSSPQEKTFSYRIVNSVGEIVEEKNIGVVSGSAAGQLNISKFPGGLYLFILSSGYETHTIKFIKQ